MTSKTGLRLPSHIKGGVRRWCLSVIKDFVLDEHHVRLLILSAEAWQRGVAAREVIDRLGMTYDDRFGQPKMRPEILVERDSRLSFVRILRELDLDLDAPGGDAKRPPQLTRFRGGPHAA